MASSIRFGGGAGCNNRLNLDSASSRLNARLPSSASMKKSRSGFKVSMCAATRELSRVGSLEATKKLPPTKIDHEKMDEWMPQAVVEIVRNLNQAPLLMQVYDRGGDNSGARVKTEKAVAEDWAAVKESWSGIGEAPEGVILVEEIAEEEEATKAWGIVIQGRGCEYGPACYLLKTSRVRSGMGSGCTHFCLTKVTSFRESALSQLSNCWLLH